MESLPGAPAASFRLAPYVLAPRPSWRFSSWLAPQTVSSRCAADASFGLRRWLHRLTCQRSRVGLAPQSAILQLTGFFRFRLAQKTCLSRCASDSDPWLAPPTRVFWLTSDLRLRLSPESSILQLTGFFNSRLSPKPGSSGVPLMLPLGLRRRLHLLASPVGCFRLSPAAAPWLSGDTAFRLSSEPASSGCADHSRSTLM